MLTYAMWGRMCTFYWDDTIFDKMALYAFSCFASLITIPVDIVASPFEIMGIIIYFITRRKK